MSNTNERMREYMMLLIKRYLFIYVHRCISIHLDGRIDGSAPHVPSHTAVVACDSGQLAAYMHILLYRHTYYTDGLYTKRTRAHTHRELIREWLLEPKGSSLKYI